MPHKPVIMSPEERVRRTELESRVWEMASDGHSYREIGRELNISHETARNILKRVESREHEALKQRGLALKATQFARLQRIANLARKEFLRSCEPRRTVKAGPDGEEVISTTISEVAGNLQALMVEMAALKDQRDLMGLDVMPAVNTETAELDAEIRVLEIAIAQHRALEGKEAADGTQAG